MVTTHKFKLFHFGFSYFNDRVVILFAVLDSKLVWGFLAVEDSLRYVFLADEGLLLVRDLLGHQRSL